MTAHNWKDIAELVGIGAIVASLLFVGLQMRQAQEIALSQGNIDNLVNKFSWSDKVNANVDVWLRGNAGDELSLSEAEVFRNLVRDRNDLAYFNIVRARRMGLDNAADAALADFVGYLYDNPGAYRTWIEREKLLDRNRDTLATDEYQSFGFGDEVEMQLEIMKAKLQ